MKANKMDTNKSDIPTHHNWRRPTRNKLRKQITALRKVHFCVIYKQWHYFGIISDPDGLGVFKPMIITQRFAMFSRRKSTLNCNGRFTLDVSYGVTIRAWYTRCSCRRIKDYCWDLNVIVFLLFIDRGL